MEGLWSSGLKVLENYPFQTEQIEHLVPSHRPAPITKRIDPRITALLLPSLVGHNQIAKESFFGFSFHSLVAELTLLSIKKTSYLTPIRLVVRFLREP